MATFNSLPAGKYILLETGAYSGVNGVYAVELKGYVKEIPFFIWPAIKDITFSSSTQSEVTFENYQIIVIKI